MEVFQSSPLIGIGWGRFVEEASTGIAAHNWYIAVLAETGITGFALWMLFILASALGLRTKPRGAQTVGYSVLATWMVAALFIEVPVVYGSAGLVLIRPGGCDRRRLDATRAGSRNASRARFSPASRTGPCPLARGADWRSTATLRLGSR